MAPLCNEKSDIQKFLPFKDNINNCQAYQVRYIAHDESQRDKEDQNDESLLLFAFFIALATRG